MPIAATKECWSELFRGFVEVGFLSKSPKFNLEWEKENIRFTLPKKLYNRLKQDLEKRKGDLKKIFYLGTYFKKKSRGENCKIIIPDDGKHLADIHFMMQSLLSDLRKEKGRRIFGIKKKTGELLVGIFGKFFKEEEIGRMKYKVYYKKGIWYLDICFGKRRKKGFPYILKKDFENVNEIPAYLEEYLKNMLKNMLTA